MYGIRYNVLLAGTGIGLVYVPTNVIVQKYFNEKRALAVGIASTGLSCGTLIFGPVFRLLITSYGWRGGLVMYAGVLAQIIIFAALMRPLPHAPRSRTKSRTFIKRGKQKSDKALPEATEEELAAIAKEEARPECNHSHSSESNHPTKTRTIRDQRRRSSVAKSVVKIFDLSLFRNPTFVLFLLARGFSHFGIACMYKYGVARAVSLGIDKLQASFLIACIGVSSTISRFSSGALGSLQCVNRVALFGSLMTTAGVVVILSPLAGDKLELHLCLFVIYGLFLGESPDTIWMGSD